MWWENEIIDAATNQRFVVFIRDNTVNVVPLPLEGVPANPIEIVRRYGSLSAMIESSFFPANSQSGPVTTEEAELVATHWQNVARSD